MKNTVFFIAAFFVLGLSSLSAQTFFVNKINLSNQNATTNSTGTLKVAAVMVEFEEDNDAVTFGTGKFGSVYADKYQDDKTIIDPLPHDKAYFEAHMQFAKNYFNKASYGQFDIDYTVLPNVVTVSKTIRNYSPLPKSDDLTPMADLASEVWPLAAEQNADFNPADYDLFVIFHAGVGRDINVPGSIGNERDVPSVYLSETSLRSVYGDTFEGIDVNGTKIFNTAILPCTESREVESVGTLYLLELSINGLLVANIASHIGLPDLFDTETGLSAIGRFGLMDGQSIFAYNGLFPALPNAWEREKLGWDVSTSYEVIAGDSLISLTCASHYVEGFVGSPLQFAHNAKFPINEHEYYLVENRQRDKNKDGAIVTVLTEGEYKTYTFSKDTTGFYSYDIDSLRGVVVDVDELDWALPGSGILVWHIDQSVINENPTAINNNEDRKGVNLVEADGIQDIGIEFTTVLGETVIGEGDSLDLWYAGNEARYYNNEFSAYSKPAAISNEGGKFNLRLFDFSGKDSVMTFRIESAVQSMSFVGSVEGYNPSATGMESDAYFMNMDNKSYFANKNNGMLNIYSMEDFSLYNSTSANLTKYYEGYNYNYFFIADDYQIKMFNAQDTDNSTNSVDLVINAIPDMGKIVDFAVEDNNSGHYKINCITENGYLINVMGNPSQMLFETEPVITKLFTPGEDLKIRFSYYDSNDEFHYLITDKDSLYTDDENYRMQESKIAFTVKLDSDEGYLTYLTTSAMGTYVYYSHTHELGVIRNHNSSYVAYDDTRLGGYNFVSIDEGELNIANNSGARLEYFPVKISDDTDAEYTVTGITDINNDEYVEVFLHSSNGNIYAFDSKTGEMIDGFPLSADNLDKYAVVGVNGNSEVYYAYLEGDTWRIYSFDKTSLGDVSAESKVMWSGKYGNNSKSSLITSNFTSSVEKEFFPEDEAYNWPNPVYNGEYTNFRFYVDEEANVTIKIFDLSGDKVKELSSHVYGGNYSEIGWETATIQSGVYFAHLQIDGVSGKSATKIIKVAVIK